MLVLIMNECQYAEEVFLGAKDNEVKKIALRLNYITRFLKQVLGLSDDDCYVQTVDWLERHQQNFSEYAYQSIIDKAISKADKNPLYAINGLTITQRELETITSLNNIQMEKIAFVLLCMCKFQAAAWGFTNNLTKYNLTELFKDARVVVPANARAEILHKLYAAGLFTFPNRVDSECLILNFVDNNSESVIKVDERNCRELAYLYLNWKNHGGYVECQKCGRLFRKTLNKKYCIECAKYQPKTDKLLTCVDCGKTFLISKYNSVSCRCESCQSEVRRKKEHDRYLNNKIPHTI